MTCEEIRALLPLYVDDGCDPARAGAIRTHLETCSDCSAAALQAARLRQTLQRQSPLPAPEGIWKSIDARLRQPDPVPTARWGGLLTIRKLAVAASLAAGVMIGIHFSDFAPPSASANTRRFPVVDVASPPGIEVAFLLAEHGRTGDLPALGTHLAGFAGNGAAPEGR